MQGLAFIGIDRLTEKCREVFFATEDFSEEAFIIANGGLYFVFADYMLMDTNQGMKDTYRECMNTTRANLESGLAELSYLMPATADTIAALSLGVPCCLLFTIPDEYIHRPYMPLTFQNPRSL